MAKEIHIKGLSALQAFLNVLPQKIQKNILRGALRAGAKVVRKAAKELAPVAEPSRKNKRKYGGYAGALRDSIRHGTEGRLVGGKVMAYVRAGSGAKKSKSVYYAHMVEYGTKPHWNNEAKTKWHPGARPKAFLRPALDGQAKNAVIACGNYIKNRLSLRNGLDTSDIQIGDDE